MEVSIPKRERLTGAQVITQYNQGRRNFSNTDLAWINLGGAKLKGTNFTDAKLRGANLEGADLTSAILKGTDLIRAYLRKTDFTAAVLTRARLTGAYVWETNFTGADLTYVRNLKSVVGLASVISIDTKLTRHQQEMIRKAREVQE